MQKWCLTSWNNPAPDFSLNSSKECYMKNITVEELKQLEEEEKAANNAVNSNQNIEEEPEAEENAEQK